MPLNASSNATITHKKNAKYTYVWLLRAEELFDFS